MKCPFCKQEVVNDAWHKCVDSERVSLFKSSRQCGKSEAMTDWMETYVENAKLRHRITALEAMIERACAELDDVHAPDCVVGEAEAQCGNNYNCAECWRAWIVGTP